MAFPPLSDLPLGRAHCGVCLRVVRFWDYCGNKEDQPPLHADMVLVDIEGNRMYAEIPGAEVDKFKALIREGCVYVLRKFVVCSSRAAYKPFQSEQMIRLTPWTTVEERVDMSETLPRYAFDLVNFEEFSSLVGQVEHFVDTIGIIIGVSEVAHVYLPSNQASTAKRVVSLKDLRNNQINLVLWGSRATDFDAECVHSIGQESPVVAIFVGMLHKAYKGEITLSGGSACKWYINEEIPEIEKIFERMLDAHSKIQWISAGEQQFRSLEQQKNLEEKTVRELRDMDPWEFEGSSYQYTVTISRISDMQPWWFPCTKCHRASTPVGNKYKCSGGCPCVTAEPKYRLSLIGTDGTATAEFTLFGRVARQIIGKSVVALIRSASKNQHGSSGSEFEHMVNSIVTFFGKQTHIPRPSEQNPNCGGESLAIIPSANLSNELTGDPSPLKNLSYIVVLCRKSLTFKSTDNEEEQLPDPGMDDNIIRTTTAEASPVHPTKMSNNNLGNTETSTCTASAAQSSHDNKPEPLQNGGKQRSTSSRRKGAC